MSATETDQNSKPKIHRQMTIDQILSMFPYKAQRLSQEISSAGLHCIGCHAATWETLEAGMLGHGMGEPQIEQLVKKLNALLEEPDSDPETITLTKRAAEKFIEILKEENKEGWGMRFGDRMAGCSGFEYILDYSEKALADDEIFESSGIQIHVNKMSAKRLRGSVIDFVDSLQSSGFKISNPHVKTSCGCGSSHNY
jgi:iron-sulfur cluster assembly protein